MTYELEDLDMGAYGVDPHFYRAPVQVEVTAYGDDVRTFLCIWEGFHEGILRTTTPYDSTPEDVPSDEHSDNGDDLRRLDEVLEEQRHRIVALGRRTSR